MAADPDAAFDEQDQAEIFDEDNTNLDDRPAGAEDAEQLEDLVDVFDATSAVGDTDDDEAVIGEDLDDDEIVALARDDDDDDDDIEDDDLRRRDAVAFHQEDDLDDVTDPDSARALRMDRQGPDEVPLEYVGGLEDLEGAHSAAQRYESRTLSDQDLRELHYNDDPEDDDMPNNPQDTALTGGRKPALSKDGGVRTDDDMAADRLAQEIETARTHQDELLDEGVEETFPASDPVSIKRIT